MTSTVKKLLSAAMALVMVLSLIPATASAKTVEVTDGVSYTENSAGWVEIGSTAEFNDWFRDTAEDSITRAAAKAGKTVTAKLILKADIALNVAGYVGTEEYPAAHNITLDLNGHSITSKDNESGRRAFSVYTGTLNLINSKETGGIEMPGALSATGGIIYSKKGNINMNNITIKRTYASARNYYCGILGLNGGSYVFENCVFDATEAGSVKAGGVMYLVAGGQVVSNNCQYLGGKAVDASSTSDKGGCLHILSGTFTMNGGLISGGYTPYYGGNVYLGGGDCVFTMNDGIIENGSAQKDENHTSAPRGSNLYIYAGKFIMNGGKIREGAKTGVNGASIYVQSIATAYFYLNGGEISHSTVTASGGLGGLITKGASAKVIAHNGKITTPNCTTLSACFASDCNEISAQDANGTFTITPKNVTAGTPVAATCTTAGYTPYTCGTCGETANSDIVLPAHSPVTVEGYAATCTETGLTDGSKCSVCNVDLAGQYATKKLGHTEEVVEGKEPTCTDTGLTEGKVCEICGEVIVAQEEIAALGHTEEVVPGKAATCTDTGLTEGKVCTVCGEVIVAQEEIAALGHTEEIIPGKASTCTDTGLTDGTKCTVCGEVIVAQEEVPTLGHKYEGVYTEPTYEADGFTTYTCSVCGDSYVETDEGTKLTAVATADGVPFESLQDALNAGGEVVLLQSVTMAEKLVINNTVTLELNEYTLQLAAVEDNYGLVVKGDLTVTGFGAILADGMYGIGVTGKLTVESGIFQTTGMADYLIGNWGTTVINGGYFNGVYNCVNNFAGTTEIYGGEFTTAEYDYTGEYESEPLLANEGLTVYGGDFNKNLDSAYIADDYCVLWLSYNDLAYRVVKFTDALTQYPEEGQDFINIVSDVTLTEKVVVEGSSVGLALHGVTLTLADVPDDYGMVVKGSLFIYKECTIVTPGTYGIGVAEGGALHSMECHYIAGEKNDYIISNFGTTNIFDGIFEGVYCCINNIKGFTYIGLGKFSTAEYDWTGEYESADVLNGDRMVIYDATFSKPIDPSLCDPDRCVKPNEDGTYSVVAKAKVLSHPSNAYADCGASATFSVRAEGEDLAYRWEYSRDGNTWFDTKLEGFDTATLTVPVILARSGYRYRCVVTDFMGNQDTSNTGRLFVNKPADQAKITKQPQAAEAVAGATAQFTVKATGNGLTYQWQYTKNGTTWHTTAMEGANTAELKVTATVARNGYKYRVIITDAYGTQVISKAAALTVTEKDITTTGPVDQVAVDGKAVFTVNVEGEDLTYAWQYQRADGTKWFYTTMTGYNTNELTVVATAARNGYKYRVIITDAYGNETVSDTATLTVE